VVPKVNYVVYAKKEFGYSFFSFSQTEELKVRVIAVINAFVVVLTALGTAIFFGIRSSVPITVPGIVVGPAAGIAAFLASYVLLVMVTNVFWGLIFSPSRRDMLRDMLGEIWYHWAILAPAVAIGFAAWWLWGFGLVLPATLSAYVLIIVGIYWYAELQIGGILTAVDERREKMRDSH
jgi:hypothetical protein